MLGSAELHVQFAKFKFHFVSRISLSISLERVAEANQIEVISSMTCYAHCSQQIAMFYIVSLPIQDVQRLRAGKHGHLLNHALPLNLLECRLWR